MCLLSYLLEIWTMKPRVLFEHWWVNRCQSVAHWLGAFFVIWSFWVGLGNVIFFSAWASWFTARTTITGILFAIEHPIVCPLRWLPGHRHLFRNRDFRILLGNLRWNFDRLVLVLVIITLIASSCNYSSESSFWNGWSAMPLISRLDLRVLQLLVLLLSS